MKINPKEPYTLTQLNIWFMEAIQKGETLEIFPVNPTEVPFLQCGMELKERDDVACLTQWLGGLPL